MDQGEVCPICGRYCNRGWLCQWCGSDLKKRPEAETVELEWRALGQRALRAAIPASLTVAALLSIAIVLSSGTQKVRGAAQPASTAEPTEVLLLGIPRITRTPTPAPTASLTPSPTPTRSPTPLPSPTLPADTTWLDRSFAVATEDVEAVAYIVGGEANCMSRDAQVMVACQVWGDVAEGMSVSALSSRWYGYQKPNASAWDATVDALLGTSCQALQRCRYVINDNDMRKFLRDGLLEPEDLGISGGSFWLGLEGDVLYCIPK